jgi:hypothetical protein|tara:strand:+ start:3394 stop:3540 length:147 start_codon:yes stop_codon:yes gene_type:complete
MSRDKLIIILGGSLKWQNRKYRLMCAMIAVPISTNGRVSALNVAHGTL